MYYACIAHGTGTASPAGVDFLCACNRHKCACKRRVWRPCRAEQPDLVERIFGGLFGKKALQDRTPFGMKRMVSDILKQKKISRVRFPKF